MPASSAKVAPAGVVVDASDGDGAQVPDGETVDETQTDQEDQKGAVLPPKGRRASTRIQIEKVLEQAHREGKKRRQRITHRCLKVGGTLLVLGIVFGYAASAVDPSAELHVWLEHLGFIGVFVGVVIAGVAILPNDRAVIKRVSYIGVPLVSLAILKCLADLMGYRRYVLRDTDSNRCGWYDSDDDENQVPCAYYQWRVVYYGLWMFAYVMVLMGVIMVVFIRPLPPRLLLDWCWRTIGRNQAFTALVLITDLVVCFRLGIFDLPSIPTSYAPLKIVAALVRASLAAALMKKEFRHIVHGWLTSHGEEISTAAGIAAVLGGKSATAVHQLASGRFKAIPLNALTEEEMAKNTPDQELYTKSKVATLGEVDAFLSHSWSDDPKEKWAAITEWRDDFRKANNGREPNVWIDKCSIDQRDIEANLTCLPIFLAGCQRLLVLCGDTYIQRLWCVMELFVFLEMGGLPDNIELVMLPSRDSGRRSLKDRFRGFDACNAKCYSEDDTQRLLGIIEAGFGDLRSFNELVREVLVTTSTSGPQDSTAGLGLSDGSAPAEMSSKRGLSGARGSSSGHSGMDTSLSLKDQFTLSKSNNSPSR